MRLCVVIPAFNESKAIGGLVKEIRQLNLAVLIVDDGSTDDTSKIAQAAGAKVLKNNINYGKGSSLILGFTYALSNGFDGVITMDGDGQHLTQDLPLFLETFNKNNSCIIIGNRMTDSRNMPLIRVLTNKFMSWLISIICKQKIPDTQCGFRLIKSEVLNKLNLKTSKFETESEILIEAARFGFKIESVPIKTIYQGQISQINPFIDSFRFIRFIVKELIFRRTK